MHESGTSPARTHVLIVEDDPGVRAATLLRDRNDIGVVFTDVDMPGALNGFDLARIAQAMQPPIAVLVVSGGLPPGFSRVAPDTRFMRKPYRMTEVLRTIHEMVDQARPQPGSLASLAQGS